MRESFKLAFRALVRGHVLTLLMVATALVHFWMPSLVRSDGTAAGWREMFVRAVPGSVYAIVVLTLLACACGLFAQERERFRLSLTVVRPISAVAVAAGRWLALCAVAACALAFNAALTAARMPSPPRCLHHFAPALPPPVETAKVMMADYLADPATPEAVKRAPKSAVLSLLTNKEFDRYDVVPSGATMAWPFAPELATRSDLLVRVRFATQFELRAPLEGVKRTIADGTKAEIESNSYGTEKTTVDKTAVEADGKKYLFINMPDSLTGENNSAIRRAMADGGVSVKVTYRASQSSTLIPPSAVRADGDNNYVYLVQMQRGSLLSSNMMKVVKTGVTVIERSDKVVSVAEDFGYQQIADREDRALSDGQAVMEYVN